MSSAAAPSSGVQGLAVLITGGAGGLGRAIAETYLAAGANVFVCDINKDRLAATEAEWTKAFLAGRFATKVADVSSEASVDALVAAVVERFGGLDVLINNAGIMDDFSPAGECDLAQWNRVLGINLTGPFLATRAAVRVMDRGAPAAAKEGGKEHEAGEAKPAPPAGKGGVIINIGSVASLRGFHAGVAYTAAKAGLLGLTRNTAAYYGPRGVSCMALLLGAMSTTNIFEAFRPGAGASAAARMHMEAYQRIMAANPHDPDQHELPPAAVARYCLFLSDREIAHSANGSCNVFSNNWPSQ